ncbi:MAG: hypothetical protein GX793_04810 [Bacteroidales bacterium]|nr:hypothetical protein [Bacteroidales bacterium]
MKNKKKILISILNFVLIYTLFSCSFSKDWIEAEITYTDRETENLLVNPQNFSYYTYIKSKKTNDAKSKNLIPENVFKIKGKDFLYIAMFFDEANYGMESWSFAKVLAGENIMLVETKYQAKTCSCNTSGKFFKDYFLVYEDYFVRIKTFKKTYICDKQEIYSFIEKYYKNSYDKEFNNIEDLTKLIRDINN